MSSIVTGTPANGESERQFIDGSTRSHTLLRSAVIGLGVYKPGWRWSRHAGPQTGKPSANHIGYVISGSMMVKDAAGGEQQIGPGFAFEVGPGHDAWVVGDAPCTALDFIPMAGPSSSGA
jgi:redox-sensitive bicupin YhaK (pirin superfamily)